MPSTSPQPSRSELLEELSSFGAGLGLITMIGFPFALPAIALTLLALALVAIPAVAAGLLAAVLLGPVMLLRRLRANRRREADSTVAPAIVIADGSVAVESRERSVVRPASRQLPTPRARPGRAR